MRFFEQQRQARAQTIRLLLLFIATVLLVVLAVNAELALTWRLVAWQDAAYPAYFFQINTGVTMLFILGGWWIESSNVAGGGEQLARREGAARQAARAVQFARSRDGLFGSLRKALGQSPEPEPEPKPEPKLTTLQAATAAAFKPLAGRTSAVS